ncbi:MAG: 2-isopropylmalate synthase, partial [Clostridiales bacterium]|nr:2-isopropylmalate synthase [Clostridiales bacterium]
AEYRGLGDVYKRQPVWCSVDLGDGNRALVEPMSLEVKLDFFRLLVQIGFKEIEVGFPAASEAEYEFMRALIEQNLIPDDVTVQVLTQAREHIIERTFEAVKGAKNVIVHVSNGTSAVQREQVFGRTKDDIKRIAVDAAKLLKDQTEKAGADYRFEYSPESFTGTEPEFALEVVNAVLDVWQPTAERKAIINLPATVENAMPHVYAQQVEYINKNMKYRDGVVLSLHTHNDRGTGVASAEFGLLAGADRVEGTLFGNGERTGNCDLITLAMNMISQGVETGLDFSDMPRIAKKYELFTQMSVSPRQPYAGELVFAAFSGVHQNAIAKSMHFRAETNREIWDVPYLPIDPKDMGREYDSDAARIGSQSGKALCYVLEQAYGYKMPAGLREAVGYVAKRVSDEEHRELKSTEVYEVFSNVFIKPRKIFDLGEVHFRQENGMTAVVEVLEDGKKTVVEANGNGRLDAVSNALKKHFHIEYTLTGYEQHALARGSAANAVSYVGVDRGGKIRWGVGEHSDIATASINALVSALNRYL